jgi:protein involved in polysaccharide export with SLBB domain
MRSVKNFLCGSLCFFSFAICAWGQSEGNKSNSDGGIQASESYVISSLDYLRMRIIGHDNISTEIRVSGDGTVSLPYISTIRVAGKTVQEARREIYERYNADYFVEPQIELTVISYSPRRVQVLGMVNSQGDVIFPPEEKMTLLGAIARAGGWSNNRLADKRRVSLTRVHEDGEVEVREIDVTKLTSQDEPLQDGDTIVVPERTW